MLPLLSLLSAISSSPLGQGNCLPSKPTPPGMRATVNGIMTKVQDELEAQCRHCADHDTIAEERLGHDDVQLTANSGAPNLHVY